MSGDYTNAIVIANAGAGGDVDSAIFEKAREMKTTYKKACDWFRLHNHKYRQVVLENYDYDSNIVRSNEIHRGRLYMLKYELSEHSAQDIMRKRLKSSDSENLDKHKHNLCYLGRMDLYIALLGVHQRVYEMNKHIISESDELMMRRQASEVLGMAACDLHRCSDITYFQRSLAKYVTVITDPKFGVQRETVLDEHGDPIVVHLVDKKLNQIYVSTIRVFMNGPSMYRPEVGLTTFLQFSMEGFCWQWNKYVIGGSTVDCPAKKDSFHARMFHKCPRHPWVIDNPATQHREMQCPSLRQTFKPAPYDPSLTLPSKETPKVITRKINVKTYDDNDNKGGKRKQKYPSRGYRGDPPRVTPSTANKQET